MGSDFYYIVKWWLFLFGFGMLFFPLGQFLFYRFVDKGYIFSKILGIAVVSYIVFVLGTFHILPFNRLTVWLVILGIVLTDFFILKKHKIILQKRELLIIIFQELFFFCSLLFWSYIKAFQPDIHGLEKFMDFGFINSILRSSYFPPIDMWFPPLPINYYYFGHLVTALLIKLTAITPFIAFNLMLATIFGLTTTSAFSLVATFTYDILRIKRTSFLTGILGSIIVSLGGNLQTIYAFFAPYTPPDNPVPFWQLKFLPFSFPNNYWYPNATRFIPFTIHEFPSYSFVVSDLHGHVLDIPFVFLTLALIYSVFLKKRISFKISIVISFMLALMYMTNAWDGIIYFILFILTIILWKSEILKIRKKKKTIKWFHIKAGIGLISNKKRYVIQSLKLIMTTGIGYLIFVFPFNLHFKPFISGIGVVCAPNFLTHIGKIGPLLFEANHCQRSPFWMLVILYGFFYFFAVSLILKIMKLKKTPLTLIFMLLLILLSTILIATPEFIYAKDIYPAHYRANTMFKLGYQAFIMLSLVSSFSIAYLFHKGKRIFWLPITFVLLALILSYPYFAVTSYFGNLKNYKGLDGLSYLKTISIDDYNAVVWIQKNISGQPVLLEAQGDSYTDYERISANTGLPTPLGWTVHEWLWRGNYSFPQSRLDDIKTLYEGTLQQTRPLLRKYNISYVIVGDSERSKYPNINDSKFSLLGTVIFESGNTRIYKLNVL